MITSATQSQVQQVRNPKAMAFVLMVGAFIGLFSETALNMALTNIMDDFAISTATVQWLTTGYLLMLGILVPVSTFLIQWFTTKQLVVASLAFSVTGTILAAISPNFTVLLIGRLIQAVGTGILLPLMMNVILVIFPIQKRGAIMGVMGLVITTAPATGPTVSGLIVDALNWTYIFWVSLFFFAALIIFGLRQIDNVSIITKPKVDVLSISLSTIGFGGLIYSLSAVAEQSFASAQVWIPCLLGAAGLVLFVIRQFRLKQPMINLRVFSYPMFTLGTILVFISMVLILSTAILLPLYLKGVLLVSAAIAGLTLLPGSLLNALLSPIVGRLFDRFGAKKFVPLGFLLVLLSSLLYVWALTADTSLWQILAGYMILFLGISMIMMPAQTNGLNQLPRDLYTDGSAVMNTLQQIAGATGTALAILLMTSGQSSYSESFPDASAAELLAGGVKYAFYFITAISFAGLVASLFVKRVRV
ncbi:MDR family MFS transporter [Paenibacillus radicis (ex Gao et al. 2016)]|uniref:Lincomycin resistance protein LmrB n=1 Tax=Paenibacillus radicis (ex Gao et al. 2016) TaxID=1737354 RepID=A0A917M2A4_9BACL|nr:MDR family MFS transporter [Paenibacillus radicis (ex Gao et al. 2016)]GGG72633.1 lincomycin resistance protein LmrB [Paenibacillus radicis (ex Gao et al. 2016)]